MGKTISNTKPIDLLVVKSIKSKVTESTKKSTITLEPLSFPRL